MNTPEDDLDLPQLDIRRVAELRGLRNGRLLAGLAQGYRDQGQREISAIRKAVNTGDLQRGARLAHSLKSSSMNIGAQMVGAISRRLEGDMHVGRTDALITLCDELEKNFAMAIAELEEVA
jgi:HPt (histidine-containing phosphotransfer) domain-containing protein